MPLGKLRKSSKSVLSQSFLFLKLKNNRNKNIHKYLKFYFFEDRNKKSPRFRQNILRNPKNDPKVIKKLPKWSQRTPPHSPLRCAAHHVIEKSIRFSQVNTTGVKPSD